MGGALVPERASINLAVAGIRWQSCGSNAGMGGFRFRAQISSTGGDELQRGEGAAPWRRASCSPSTPTWRSSSWLKMVAPFPSAITSPCHTPRAAQFRPPPPSPPPPPLAAVACSRGSEKRPKGSDLARVGLPNVRLAQSAEKKGGLLAE